MSPSELAELRRKKRNAKTYRYQKAARTRLRTELLASRGGRCETCGYDVAAWALEFHHRDAGSKEFAVSRFGATRARMWSEALKCDLLCANCHRSRHLPAPANPDNATIESRRRTKRRAIAHLGGHCVGCGAVVPAPAFEFHHLDSRTKEFAVSHDGITRRWDKIEAELAKCVLLCANCHREVHAGVRRIGEGDGPYETRTDPLHKRCA